MVRGGKANGDKAKVSGGRVVKKGASGSMGGVES